MTGIWLPVTSCCLADSVEKLGVRQSRAHSLKNVQIKRCYAKSHRNDLDFSLRRAIFSEGNRRGNCSTESGRSGRARFGGSQAPTKPGADHKYLPWAKFGHKKGLRFHVSL